MFTFLLVIHALIAASLVGVILMQRSEGGGLGMGGSPSGLMSARGAADFLTRATTVLATLFVLLSIALAVVATQRAAPSTIDTSLARTPVPVAPTPAVPLAGDPLAAAAGALKNEARAPAVPLATPAAPRRPVTSSATSRTVVRDRPAAVAPAAAPPPVTVTTPAPITAPTPTPAPTGNSN